MTDDNLPTTPDAVPDPPLTETPPEGGPPAPPTGAEDPPAPVIPARAKAALLALLDFVSKAGSAVAMPAMTGASVAAKATDPFRVNGAVALGYPGGASLSTGVGLELVGPSLDSMKSSLGSQYQFTPLDATQMARHATTVPKSLAPLSTANRTISEATAALPADVQELLATEDPAAHVDGLFSVAPPAGT